MTAQTPEELLTQAVRHALEQFGITGSYAGVEISRALDRKHFAAAGGKWSIYNPSRRTVLVSEMNVSLPVLQFLDEKGGGSMTDSSRALSGLVSVLATGFEDVGRSAGKNDSVARFLHSGLSLIAANEALPEVLTAMGVANARAMLNSVPFERARGNAGSYGAVHAMMQTLGGILGVDEKVLVGKLLAEDSASLPSIFASMVVQAARHQGVENIAETSAEKRLRTEFTSFMLQADQLDTYEHAARMGKDFGNVIAHRLTGSTIETEYRGTLTEVPGVTHASGNVPALTQFVNNAPAAAADIIKGKTYVTGIFTGIPRSMKRGVGDELAFFCFDNKQGSGPVSLSPDIGSTLQNFFNGELKPCRTEADIVQQLVQVKDTFGILLHELLHGTGSGDVASDMAAFQETMPGFHVFAEGLTEFGAQRFLDRFLAETGVAARETRLMEVHGSNDLYVGEVSAVQKLVETAADRSGASVDDTLMEILRFGHGERSLDLLARKLLPNAPERGVRDAVATIQQGLVQAERTFAQATTVAALRSSGIDAANGVLRELGLRQREAARPAPAAGAVSL